MQTLQCGENASLLWWVSIYNSVDSYLMFVSSKNCWNLWLFTAQAAEIMFQKSNPLIGFTRQRVLNNDQVWLIMITEQGLMLHQSMAWRHWSKSSSWYELHFTWLQKINIPCTMATIVHCLSLMTSFARFYLISTQKCLIRGKSCSWPPAEEEREQSTQEWSQHESSQLSFFSPSVTTPS